MHHEQEPRRRDLLELPQHFRTQGAYGLSVLRSKTAERARVRPSTIPHPKIIEGYIRNVLTIVEGDPARGREILARHIQPLVLTPTDDGYGITGAFDLATAIHAADRGVSENGSRRDRLRDLS